MSIMPVDARWADSMPGLTTLLAHFTTGFSFGGAVLALVAPQNGASWPSVALAGIGFATICVRSHYAYKDKRLKVIALESENSDLRKRVWKRFDKEGE